MHPCRAQARRIQPERGAGGEQHGAAHGWPDGFFSMAACAQLQPLLLPEALKMVNLIAAMPPLAVMQMKEVVLAGVDASL